MEGSFTRLGESELSRLDDESLIDYIARARDADDLEAAKLACGILAYGHGPTIRARVGGKVPATDVEDVVNDVFESVVKSVFDSKTVGQFGAWLRTITQRRIADFHRGREGDPDSASLDADPEEGGVEAGAEENGYVGAEIREAAIRVLDSRRDEHQVVIRLYGPNELGYMGLSASETVLQFGVHHPAAEMSEQNVHQIWRRFKSDLHGELGLEGSG